MFSIFSIFEGWSTLHETSHEFFSSYLMSAERKGGTARSLYMCVDTVIVCKIIYIQDYLLKPENGYYSVSGAFLRCCTTSVRRA